MKTSKFPPKARYTVLTKETLTRGTKGQKNMLRILKKVTPQLDDHTRLDTLGHWSLISIETCCTEASSYTLPIIKTPKNQRPNYDCFMRQPHSPLLLSRPVAWHLQVRNASSISRQPNCIKRCRSLLAVKKTY